MTKDGKLTKKYHRFDEWLKSRGLTYFRSYGFKPVIERYKKAVEIQGMTIQDHLEQYMLRTIRMAGLTYKDLYESISKTEEVQEIHRS